MKLPFGICISLFAFIAHSAPQAPMLVEAGKGVTLTWRKGSDGCPMLVVENATNRKYDVHVSYTIRSASRAGVGGSRNDVLDGAAPGRTIYETNVLGVPCDRPYDFQVRPVRIQEL